MLGRNAQAICNAIKKQSTGVETDNNATPQVGCFDTTAWSTYTGNLHIAYKRF